MAIGADAVPPARRRRGRSSGSLPDGRTVQHLRHGQPGAGPARGRPLRLRRVPDRATACCPPRSAEAAQIQATRFEPEVFVPPLPGHRGPPGHGRRRATRRCSSTRWTGELPAGLSRDDEPLYLDLDFLDGTRGAHVNICGISGVATKTSYATFLLYTLFHSGVLGARGGQHQGPDLQRQGRRPPVPRPRQHPARRRRARPATPTSACPRGRSAASAVCAPPRRDDPTAAPDVAGRTVGVTPSSGRSREFCEDELLPFLFADAEDERQQYTMVVHNVTARLAADAQAAGDGGGAHRRRRRSARSASSSSSSSNRRHRRGRRPAAGPGGPSAAGTVNAFVRRLHGSIRHLRPPDPGRRRPTPRAHRVDARRARSPSSTSTTCTTGPSASSSASSCARPSTSKERAGHGPPAAVRRARRAQQVRATRGLQPDQGDPARRRRARPLARHHPDRRPADRQRGRAPHRGQLAPSGSSAGSTRPRPARAEYGFLPAGAAAAGHDHQAGHDVRVPARDPGAAGRRVPVPGLGDPRSAEAGVEPARRRTSPTTPFEGL